MLGFGRRRREAEEAPVTPPVVVPADAIRPGEDDRALVRALVRYVQAMRRDGPYAFGELDPDAAAAFAVDGYLDRVERGGHAAYLVDLPSPAMLSRCQDGLERTAPALAAVHGTLMAAVARAPVGDPAMAPEPLDEAFREAGGRTAVDPTLAGLIAGIDGLEIVPPEAYAGRMAEIAAAHPEGPERHRDLRVAELQSELTSSAHAGVAIILARTAGQIRPFALRQRRDGGEAELQWDVETPDETFRAARYPDRMVVFRGLPDGSGFTGLGHLSHEKIAVTCAWAAQSHVALASMLGLAELGLDGRLATIVFDRRKLLKKSNVEAAAFHLALEGEPGLALVVFPRVCAVVDPRTNQRLAEIEHDRVREQAEAHGKRLAALLD